MKNGYFRRLFSPRIAFSAHIHHPQNWGRAKSSPVCVTLLFLYGYTHPVSL